jgi:ABC-type lipoprotein release transport system permease subunit
MEKFGALFKLGLIYLYRYRRRYGFLCAALVFGFAVVTFITSIKDRMRDNVYYAAQSHYAGDIIAVGRDAGMYDTHLGQNEIAAVLDAARDAGIGPERTVMRTLFGNRGIVYYYGTAVRLKYVLGVDWEDEAFDRLDFAGEARIPAGAGAEGSENAVILSEPAADELGVRIGDGVTLEVETVRGQKNTGTFVVCGIVRDTSIFGYHKVYVSRTTLNRMTGLDDGDCSSVGFFLKDRRDAERKRAALQKALEGRVPTAPLVRDRTEYAEQGAVPWTGIRVFLLTLPVYLSEVSDLLNAVNIIAYFLFAMMLAIILVSAAVTYRLIIHERAKELGIMRAVGFYGGDLRGVLWTEAGALGAASLAAGFLLALVLSFCLSLVSFSWFPSFEIFMSGGKLTSLFLPKTMLINIASVFAALFAAVWFPAFAASRKPLPLLLSGEST